jgi:hypothetical protein
VQNLFTFTEAFGNAAWVSTTTGDGSITAGSTLTVSVTSSGQAYKSYSMPNATAGEIYVISFNATGFQGATQGTQVITHTGTATFTNNIPANFTTDGRVTITLTCTGSGTFNVRIGLGVSGAYAVNRTLVISRPQIENVIGQTNQNPAEYVSVGVLSAPYHGAAVDGVKYFPTLNGNTVASNVVTEAQGAAISSSILGGYLAEAAATNLCLQSEDFGTTWTVLNNTVSVNSIAAPNGVVTADRIVETAVNAQHYIDQAVTKAASALAYTYACYAKQGERSAVQIILGNSGLTAYVQAIFDLSTGTIAGAASVVGAFTTPVSEITPMANGWYRISVSAVSDTDTTIRARMFTGSNTSTFSYLGDITKGLYYWGAQLVQASVIGLINSYIPTVAATVTRNADVLTYPTTGWLNASAGTLYAEWFNPNLSQTAYPASINDASANNVLSIGTATITSGTFGVTTGGVAQAALSAVSITGGAVAKADGIYQANDFAGFANNTSLGTDAAGTIPTVTRLEVGAQAGASYLGHYIRRVSYIPQRINSTAAQALTQ